jgi:xanthine dehydrogenase accessory factor
VVASLGHGDEEAVRRGLQCGCEYVGLVASRVRGAAVLDELRSSGVPDDQLARVRTPAGLAIGAATHEEIALSILAELVAVRRSPAVPSAGGAGGDGGSREVVDPVCGMTVVVGPATPTAGGHAFCCAGCRDAWLAHAG